jgi:hypothetical protein
MTMRSMKGETVCLSKLLRSKVTLHNLDNFGNLDKFTSGLYVLRRSVLSLSISCSNAVLVQLIALYNQHIVATCKVARGCPSVTFDEYGRAPVL